MADLLPVADYVERILATVSPLPAFPQPLMEALGLALAEDVVAPISPTTGRVTGSSSVAPASPRSWRSPRARRSRS